MTVTHSVERDMRRILCIYYAPFDLGGGNCLQPQKDILCIKRPTSESFGCHPNPILSMPCKWAARHTSNHEAHPRDSSRTIEHVSANSNTFCRIIRTNSWRHLAITIRACLNRESQPHSVTTGQSVFSGGHIIAWHSQNSVSCRPQCTAAVSLQDEHAAMQHAP